MENEIKSFDKLIDKVSTEIELMKIKTIKIAKKTNELSELIEEAESYSSSGWDKKQKDGLIGVILEEIELLSKKIGKIRNKVEHITTLLKQIEDVSNRIDEIDFKED